MAELVPFYNGMKKGQGYNTFLQQVKLENAVFVTEGNPPPRGFERTYNSELIDSYEKLAKTLNITAGAAISGYGQSAEIDFGYLNRSEFETSTVTYQVKVDVQYQSSTGSVSTFNSISTSTPHDTYGDRYISDFINGGHFYARVSITSINQSNTEEVKTAAKVAFQMYGATGTVTNEVKTSVEKLSKLSETRIFINETTGGGSAFLRTASEDVSDLYSIKAQADQFYKDADTGKHNYVRFALLSRYTNLPNFDNAFVPLDYNLASQRSWVLFNDFTLYQTFDDMIKNVPANKWKEGPSKPGLLNFLRIDEIEQIQKKIQRINKDPEDSKIPGTYIPAEVFLKDIYRAIVTDIFIAQSKPTGSDGNWTDTAQKTLSPGSTRIFEFRAFSFPNIRGTIPVSFGKAINEESYAIVIGGRLNDVYGWREESVFWCFYEKLGGVADQVVLAFRLKSRNYIRLELAGDSGTFFARAGNFNAPKVIQIDNFAVL